MPCHPQSNARAAASPRSSHVGGVNVAHIDGSAAFVQDDIDLFLMARLVSINDGQGEHDGAAK